MPTPRPSAYADAHWLRRGRELLRPGKCWTVAGFPGYTINEAGQLHRAAYFDGRGHRRAAKEIKRSCLSGTLGFFLRRNGCPVWVGLRQLRTLLVRA